MRSLLIIMLSLLLFSACSRVNPEEPASKAAKDFHDQLLAGNYDAFVAGMDLPDSLPADYREQLQSNMKMFVGQQQDEHLGIREVRIVRAEPDTALHTVNVLLVYCYGDSTSEEVCVPMVERAGEWRMR